MRKITCSILLLILIIQPVALLSGLMLAPEMTVKEKMALAQEPGTRLEFEEHTPHVPILITESADFVDQGWPGSGTDIDPYVISGLSINFDVGLPLIEIEEVDDYFVIRDCWLMQNSTVPVIQLTNTTHGTIEYCDVYNDADGIFLWGANNTVIDHVLGVSYWGVAYPLLLLSSNSVTISDSSFRNPGGHVVTVDYSDDFTSSNNIYVGGLNGRALELDDSDGFSSTGDSITTPNTGMDIEVGSDITVTGVEITGASTGIYLTAVNQMTIDAATIEVTELGIGLSSCVDVNITDSRLEGGVGDAIFSSGSSNRSTIDGNTIIDFDGNGVDLGISRDYILRDSVFEGIGGSCINMDSCHQTTIDGNDILQPGAAGIYIDTCNDTLINMNRIDGTGTFPIEMQSSYHGEITNNALGNNSGNAGVAIQSNAGDWLIADNTMNELWGGVFLGGSCFDIDCHRNTIIDMSSYGLGLQLISDPEVINNTIINGGSWGIYLDSTLATPYVEGNTIKETNIGIYLFCDDAHVLDNHILRSRNYGILFDSGSSDAEIRGNYFGNTEDDSLRISGSGHEIVENIFDGGLTGVFANSISNCTFEDNNFTDCGIYFSPSLPLQSYNHSFSGNYINNKPFYYALNGNGLALNGDDYGSLMLVNCTTCDVTGGSFINSSTSVSLFYCDEVDISGTNSQYNIYSMTIDESTNVTLFDSIFRENPDVPNSHGARFRQCEDVFIENVTIIDMFGDRSLYIDNTLDTVIQNCDFIDSETGVFLMNSDYATIQVCAFTNVGTGLYFWGTEDSVVYNNDFDWCNAGIYGQASAHNNNVTDNNFYNNWMGVNLFGVDGWNITGNDFRWNTWYGVWLQNSAIASLSSNVFIGNAVNGQDDDSTSQFWDNQVDTGNYWSDFDGSAPYEIAGVAGSTDRYPIDIFSVVTGPLISSPEDLEYAEFSEGNEIIWYAFDDNLRDWEVYIDGDLWYTGAWNFDNITINIDGLSYGVHEVFINLRDLSDNEVNDTVEVTVFDDTVPIISNPSNKIVFYGVDGEVIVWQVSDQNPSSYELHRDDLLITSGSWSSGEFAANLDGLAEGEYIFTLTIFDVDDNSVSDSVKVTVVRDDVSPIVIDPADFNYTAGTIGNVITWVANDDNPSHYVVEITDVNTTGFTSGDWGGGSIQTDVDGLASGDYVFTITVYDLAGNMATANVTVEVIPVGGYPLPPPDYTLLIVALLGIGGVVAIVILYFYVNKRRSAE